VSTSPGFDDLLQRTSPTVINGVPPLITAVRRRRSRCLLQHLRCAVCVVQYQPFAGTSGKPAIKRQPRRHRSRAPAISPTRNRQHRPRYGSSTGAAVSAVPEMVAAIRVTRSGTASLRLPIIMTVCSCYDRSFNLSARARQLIECQYMRRQCRMIGIGGPGHDAPRQLYRHTQLNTVDRHERVLDRGRASSPS